MFDVCKFFLFIFVSREKKEKKRARAEGGSEANFNFIALVKDRNNYNIKGRLKAFKVAL